MSAAAEPLDVVLDRLISRVDETARDLGHTPVWDHQPDGEAAYAQCDCGMTAAVRVPAWKAGKLRLERHPTPE